MERRGRGRREGRGFRGGGGRWRGGDNSRGRGRRVGNGNWRGRGGDRSGGRGRSGGIDYRDRRPAEPTADTLALMGTQAQESTVGITHFISEDVPSFSGILKQRFSDFIVHEVGPDGVLCKGTDFPGLLRPMDNTYSASDTGTVTSSTSEPPSDTVTGTGTDTGTASKCDQTGDGGVNLDVSDEDDDGNKKEIKKDVTMNDRQEEEAVGEREQKEEVKQLVKEGMESLLSVLGEEVTEKVEAFILEGVSTKGRDKRALTLPSADKGTRTKVYNLLKRHLSRYLFAVTVDEPASVDEPVSENSTTAAKTQDANVGSSNDRGGAVPHAKPEDGGNVHGDVPKAVHGGESGEDIAKAPKPDPHGPKCVQLKMNPGWRGIKGVNGKRRRGDLAEGQEDGARWGWPADRPEFCRFVLYKENCDTMGAVVRFCKHFRFSSTLVQYAGTKDKRGCTSQWCTVKKKSIEELKTFNRPLGAFKGPMVLLGNFSYVTEPLKLGALSGNRFGIVLRNVAIPKASSPSAREGERERESADHGETVANDLTDDDRDGQSKDSSGTTDVSKLEAEAETFVKLIETINRRCSRVKEQGFINYFGLQRFGTGGAPTSDVGMAMLKEDWEGAVRLVMTPRMGENEATHASKLISKIQPVVTEVTEVLRSPKESRTQ